MRGIYLVGGYPDRETFNECVHSVIESGFDFLEIGIPFNDPIADGPVIARAIHEALENGAAPDQVMDDILLLKNTEIKKYVMTYANVVYSYGIKKFSGKMADYLDGVIIPDLPNRMSRLFYDNGFDIPVVPFATLETRLSDIDMINRSKSEIIYFVGVRGITGASGNLESSELLEKIRMLKDNTDKKVIIGFGIKTRDDAVRALRIGDGFVVGTEAVKRQKKPDELKSYLNSLM
ncbi:MAG: tryptophan synthase subunit alpha [Spirochaetes bacterium RBG_16_49_21]|nr:MAG: tryptophan synthase subunit alpha [Spirochaetes bacterium RBG_16_49_21]